MSSRSGSIQTGKTEIARTIANDAGVTFIARTTADLKGQYLGHAAARIAQTFDSARASSPAILFIDEIDALTAARSSAAPDSLQTEALTQLLQELDGVAVKAGSVFVIAATNRLDDIDEAIRSRFSQRLEIRLPNQEQREELLRVLLKDRPVDTNLDLQKIAMACPSMSGRELRELINIAYNTAVERTLGTGQAIGDTVLTQTDLELAIASTA